MKKPAKKLPARTKAAKAPAKPVATPAKKVTAPAKKKSAARTEPPATFITAQINIAFGHYLTIRGEGPGLSWDKGMELDNVGTNLWTIALANATKPVSFKVLVNDLTWSTGADFVVAPGKSITVYPTF